MSFANGRNFGAPLRLIGFGVGIEGLLIADREFLPAMSRPLSQSAATISRRTPPRIHQLMNP